MVSAEGAAGERCVVPQTTVRWMTADSNYMQCRSTYGDVPCSVTVLQ